MTGLCRKVSSAGRPPTLQPASAAELQPKLINFCLARPRASPAILTANLNPPRIFIHFPLFPLPFPFPSLLPFPHILPYHTFYLSRRPLIVPRTVACVFERARVEIG